MTRILLVAASLFFFSSCSSLMQVLDQMAQESQSQTPTDQSNTSTTAVTFEQMDANSDGRLTSTEAQGSVKDGFAKLDRNKDGYLTKQEVEGTTTTTRSTRTDKRPTINN
jgi:Ca2+-binding EF-hand superfamily protein